MERKKYSLILADPPWQYDNKQQNDPARGGITYPQLTMKELYELPVQRIANDDSILVMWVTFPKLVDTYYTTKQKASGGTEHNPLSIMRAWGFRPVTTLFVWVKLNPNASIDNGSIELNDLYSGLGSYTNSNAEMAIIGRRGKMLPRQARNVKQIILSPIGKHSAKPQEQYSRLDALFGDVPRIELFARKQNPPPEGWDATGLDYDGVNIRDFLYEYSS